MKRSFLPAFLLGISMCLVTCTGVSAAEEVLFRNPAEIADPVFSPDGSAIAFTLNAEGRRSIWLYEFAHKAAKQLVSEKGNTVSPTFSPDGQTVYYCSDTDGNYDLKAFSIASGASRAITKTPEDEFRVECARAPFAAGDDDKDVYDKLFFLQGKGGAGSLCSIRADGRPTPGLVDYLRDRYAKDKVKERIRKQADGSMMLTLIPGAWTEIALKGEPDTLFVAGPDGLCSAVYCDMDQHRQQVGIELTPVKTTTYEGTAGLRDISWAPDFIHLFVSGPKMPGVYDLRTGTTAPFGPMVRRSRIAADHLNRRLAWIDEQNGEYRLCIGLEPPDPLWLTGNMGHPRIDLATPALDLVRSQRFVGRPATYRQFFEIYEGNRYHWLDSYITVDTAWFLFHLYYDFILKQLERSVFLDRITAINRAMAASARKAVESSSGENRAQIAKIQGVFEIAALLSNETLDGALKDAKRLPASLRDAIAADIRSVFDANGPSESKVLGRSVDFSQFKVRGHYEKDPRLQSYFRVMMALSQLSLKVFADDGRSPGPDLPAIAALVGIAANAKVEGKTVIEAVESICQPLSYLVGETEDIGITDLRGLLQGICVPPTSKAPSDEAFQKILFDKLAAWPKPRLNPLSGVQVVFFPQRVTLDSEVMQRLVYRAVGTEANQRLLPKLLDVMAALGSERAEKLLIEFFKENRFENYQESLAAQKKLIGAFPAGEWERSAYRRLLKSFADLLKDNGRTSLAYTGSDAWTDRLLTAALGSLATLRHDTLLYNKMGGAEAGEGGEIEDWMIRRLPSVAVDPYPEVFGGLRRLTVELFGRLSAQGYLPKNERDADSDQDYDEIFPLTSKGLTLKMIELFSLLEACAAKQAAGLPLTPAEHEKLWRFGVWCEHLTIALIRPDKEFYNIVQEETSLVADVFNGDGTCLEVALGRVFELWVRCNGPRGERLHRGGIFSFYEFEQPVSNRLSDEGWRKMMRDGKAPPPPGWTSSYLSGDATKLDFKDGWYEEEDVSGGDN